MLRKTSYLIMGLVMAAGLAHGEPMRPLLNKENKFPEIKRADVGFRYEFVETADEDLPGTSTNINNFVPLIRYRPLEPLTVTASLPFASVSPDRGDSEAGLGNATVGLELLAFQDLFDYPWIIPHAEYVFGTSDKEKGTATQTEGVKLGVAVGSMAWDVVTFVVDGRYEVNSEEDNIATLGGAIIWDISELFSVHIEMRTSSEKLGVEENHPTLWVGGMTYKASDKLTFIGRGGGGSNASEDVLVSVEAQYAL